MHRSNLDSEHTGRASRCSAETTYQVRLNETGFSWHSDPRRRLDLVRHMVRNANDGREEAGTADEAATFPRTALSGRSSSVRILVIDPNPDLPAIGRAKEGTDRPTIICEPTAEAAIAHVDTGRIDCVVSEAVGIGATPIGLLSVIRDSNSELPVVFYTTHDSAAVREQLIDAGAAEYYLKTADMARKAEIRESIHALGARYHHSHSVTPRLEDYDTFTHLMSTSFAAHDLRTGRNVQTGGLHELGHEFDGQSWSIEDIFELLHPGDVDKIHTKHRQILDGRAEPFDELHDEFGTFSETIRLRRADESYAYCLMRGLVLFEGGGPAVMYNTVTSIADVIERQWHETTAELLLSAFSVRTAAEHACETLCDMPDCEAAWVVNTRATADGDDTSVLCVSGGDRGLAPDQTTGRLNDPVTDRALNAGVTPDPSEGPTEGREHAVERCHTEEVVVETDSETEPESLFVSAVPLVHAGAAYGALTAVQTSPPVALFTRGLESVASSLAFRQTAENQKTALTADVVTRVTITLTGDHVLTKLSSAPTLRDVRLTVTNIDQPDRNTTVHLVSTRDADTTSEQLHEHASVLDDVLDVTTVAEEGDVASIYITVPQPTLADVMRTHTGVLKEFSVLDGRATFVADFSRNTDISRVVEAFREVSPAAQVTSTVQAEATKQLPPVHDFLTDKQHRALEVAVHAGFFERPQRTTADEVADILGVSRTTALRHIRLGERKLLSRLFSSA